MDVTALVLLFFFKNALLCFVFRQLKITVLLQIFTLKLFLEIVFYSGNQLPCLISVFFTKKLNACTEKPPERQLLVNETLQFQGY